MIRALGIDLGASGIRAFLEATDSPAAAINRPATSANRESDVIELIENLASELQGGFESVCLGMSGYSSLGVDVEKVAESLSQAFQCPALVTSDMATGHYAHFGEDDGATVIVGTGALAFAVGNGKHARIDGLGASVGDFGSAHWIGLTALREAKRESELSGQSSLLQELEAALGRSHHWPKLFAKGEVSTYEIAKLSQVVAKASATSDLARDVLVRAGKLVAESAMACAAAVGVREVGYGGSVLLGTKVAEASFLKELGKTELYASPLRRSVGVGALGLAIAADSARASYLVDNQLAVRSRG